MVRRYGATVSWLLAALTLARGITLIIKPEANSWGPWEYIVITALLAGLGAAILFLRVRRKTKK